MKQAKIITMVWVLSMAGMGVWIWKTQTDLTATRQKLAVSDLNLVEIKDLKERELKQAVELLGEQHKKDLASILDKHQVELSQLRAGERERMAKAFQEFSSIVEGNVDTLKYLEQIEAKVQAGEAISAIEADKLATIATGLSYLQSQYQKPFQEFAELEGIFLKQADEHLATPDMRMSFFKRTFSRNFREQEREFYRNEGERRGYQEAARLFSDAYDSAQQKMKQVNLELEKSIGAIQALVDDKRQVEDLGEFFQQARQALKTHHEMLEFAPDQKIEPSEVQP